MVVILSPSFTPVTPFSRFFFLFFLSERNSALGLKVLYLRAAKGEGISSIPAILLKF